MRDDQAPRDEGHATETDQICDVFEAAWKVGSVGELSDLQRYLPDGSPGRRRNVLIDLIAIDLEHRWQSDHQPLLDAYAAAYPELLEVSHIPLQLVLQEWRLRKQAGESLSIKDYQDRFAHLRDQLRDYLPRST